MLIRPDDWIRIHPLFEVFQYFDSQKFKNRSTDEFVVNVFFFSSLYIVGRKRVFHRFYNPHVVCLNVHYYMVVVNLQCDVHSNVQIGSVHQLMRLVLGLHILNVHRYPRWRLYLIRHIF